mgnify:CR=1 FL=1
MDNVNYEQWWGDYDELNRLNPATQIRTKIIADVLKDHKYKKILDVGCGTGELLEYLHAKFPEKELHGTDISKKALEILKKKGITKGIFLANLERVIKLDGKYDVVVCSEVIEHLKNWENAIYALKGCVNKNGIVIITTQSGKIYPHHAQLGHIQHFEPENIANQLKKAGFNILVKRTFGWPFMNLKNHLASNSLTRGALLSKNKKMAILQKVSLRIFYYLFLLSPFPGPQIIITAKKDG